MSEPSIYEMNPFITILDIHFGVGGFPCLWRCVPWHREIQPVFNGKNYYTAIDYAREGEDSQKVTPVLDECIPLISEESEPLPLYQFVSTSEFEVVSNWWQESLFGEQSIWSKEDVLTKLKSLYDIKASILIETWVGQILNNFKITIAGSEKKFISVLYITEAANGCLLDPNTPDFFITIRNHLSGDVVIVLRVGTLLDQYTKLKSLNVSLSTATPIMLPPEEEGEDEVHSGEMECTSYDLRELFGREDDYQTTTNGYSDYTFFLASSFSNCLFGIVVHSLENNTTEFVNETVDVQSLDGDHGYIIYKVTVRTQSDFTRTASVIRFNGVSYTQTDLSEYLPDGDAFWYKYSAPRSECFDMNDVETYGGYHSSMGNNIPVIDYDKMSFSRGGFSTKAYSMNKDTLEHAYTMNVSEYPTITGTLGCLESQEEVEIEHRDEGDKFRAPLPYQLYSYGSLSLMIEDHEQSGNLLIYIPSEYVHLTYKEQPIFNFYENLLTNWSWKSGGLNYDHSVIEFFEGINYWGLDFLNTESFIYDGIIQSIDDTRIRAKTAYYSDSETKSALLGMSYRDWRAYYEYTHHKEKADVKMLPINKFVYEQVDIPKTCSFSDLYFDQYSDQCGTLKEESSAEILFGYSSTASIVDLRPGYTNTMCYVELKPYYAIFKKQFDRVATAIQEELPYKDEAREPFESAGDIVNEIKSQLQQMYDTELAKHYNPDDWKGASVLLATIQEVALLESSFIDSIGNYNSIIVEWNQLLDDIEGCEITEEIKEQKKGIEERRLSALTDMTNKNSIFWETRCTVLVNNFAGKELINLLQPGDVFFII